MFNFLARVRQRFLHFGTFWHLKRALTFLLVDVVLLAFVPRRRADVVMLIRIDLLGDYILGRNFLRLVRQYEPYRGRKMVLCANLALKEMIEQYDSDVFDDYLWIDRRAMLNEFWARFRMLRAIKRVGARVAIHPMRDPYLGDCIVRATCAEERIGVECREDPNAKPGEVKRHHTTLGDYFYTRLVPETHRVSFEFQRNRRFFGSILPGVPLPDSTRFAPIAVPVPDVPRPFAVLMPGASDGFREWPTERFAQVARHLHFQRGLSIVVLGAPVDHAKAEAIQRAADDVPVRNFCGTLSLPQVVFLLSQAEIGVTNDSGGIHVLAALDRPGVAISTSFSFGWFHPYPNELHPSVSYVYPPVVSAGDMTWEECKNFYGRRNLYPITDITVKAVLARVDAVLDRAPYDDPIQALCE